MNGAYTAYLLAIVDLRTFAVVDVRIYSERTPTLIGHKMAFEIATRTACDFATAHREMLRSYQEPEYAALRARFPLAVR